MKHPWLALMLLGGCGRDDPADGPAGARLERAAAATGLIADPARASLVGSWSRDTDRVCIVPGRADTRIGALVDYGEGQGCAATGTIRRHGQRLAVRFGDCRFDARFDGDRIVFPGEVPAACDTYCVGRASLAAVTVDRISESTAEAATLRTPGGRLLCGG